MAMSYAFLGNIAEAKKAAARVMSLDPNWSAERMISEQGAVRSDEPQLIIEGTKRAELPVCASKELVTQMPNLKHLDECDVKRIAVQ